MELINNFPYLSFEAADVFAWRPHDRVVTYDPKRVMQF